MIKDKDNKLSPFVTKDVILFVIVRASYIVYEHLFTVALNAYFII